MSKQTISSLITVQLCYLGTLLSSTSDTLVAMVAMFQTSFHNMMTCRVFRMMKLDLDTSADTVPTYVTPIAFDLDVLDSQNISHGNDSTTHF